MISPPQVSRRPKSITPGRPAARPGIAPWDVILPLGLVLIGILVFLPGLSAGLVSDDFDFYVRARDASFGQALIWLIPNNHFWYRPIEDLAYWSEVRLFGYDPTVFHTISLAGHLVSATLLFRLGRVLGCGYLASGVAGLVFITTVHAQEVVWWWADLHYAFAGPLIIGSLLAFATGHRVIAVVLACLALLTDESAVLLLPLTGAAALAFARSGSVVARVRNAVKGSIAVGGLVIAYVGLRLGVGHGIWGESAPCHSPNCITSGLSNYAMRLVVRPDRALAVYAEHKRLADLAIGVLLLVVLGIAFKTWRSRPAIWLGLVWTGLTVVFFVLALWPYASDRFLYYPDMGLALMLAGFTEEAVARWSGETRTLKGAMSLAGLALFLWVASGVHMLEVRANGWVKAGNLAASIATNVYDQAPDAPRNALLEVVGVPDSLSPPFPPGNTGPYVFRNGLQSAIRIRYGRPDIWVEWTGHPAAGDHNTVVRLKVSADGSVTSD